MFWLACVFNEPGGVDHYSNENFYTRKRYSGFQTFHVTYYKMTPQMQNVTCYCLPCDRRLEPAILIMSIFHKTLWNLTIYVQLFNIFYGKM